MSSCVRLVRLADTALRCGALKQPNVLIKRRMGASASGKLQYRNQMPEHPTWKWIWSSAVMIVVVFWCGSMTYKHFGHVVGSNPDVDPSKWTDEELGIPPDDEDIYPPGYIPLAQRQ